MIAQSYVILAALGEAEKLRRQEISDVVKRIKDAIAAYGLTADDLGIGGKRTSARQAVSRKRASTAKYRDGTGNTWGGLGPRPKWLRDALESGKQLEDFKA